jgi:hypothetical protein
MAFGTPSHRKVPALGGRVPLHGERYPASWCLPPPDLPYLARRAKKGLHQDRWQPWLMLLRGVKSPRWIRAMVMEAVSLWCSVEGSAVPKPHALLGVGARSR